MINFALSFSSGSVHNVKSLDTYLKLETDKPWLFAYCLTNSADSVEELNHELNCLEEMSLRKLAIMLNGLVHVANIDCTSSTDICSKLKSNPSTPILFYFSLPDLNDDQQKSMSVSFSEHDKIYQQVLGFLPDNSQLEEKDLKV